VPALVALIRPVSSAITDCELTHLERVPIDVQRARAQHAAYASALRDRDCRVVTLPGADDLPDSVFVEDTAIVLDEIAIITRPGAPARRAEVATVAAELARHRPVTRMQPPATLDAGDVLRIGRTLFVGASSRTGSDGIAALRTAAEPFGYRVVPVALTGCLHLKTAATVVAADRLLVNPQWVDTGAFGSVHRIEVAAHEPFAGNALLVGDHVICAAAFPATSERLVSAGIAVHTVDVSELAKAEGGVTCCSIIFEDREMT
jgi:dimethylargininase